MDKAITCNLRADTESSSACSTFTQIKGEQLKMVPDGVSKNGGVGN